MPHRAALARLHLRARGVPRDPAAAAALFRRACEAGRPDACVTHAALEARALPPDPTRTAAALQLITSACDAGLLGACTTLGELLADGIALPRDEARAFALWQADAQRGLPRALALLGESLLEGTMAPPDPAQAEPLLDRACNAAVPEACADLAFLRSEGLTAPPDEPRAKALFDRACFDGHELSCALASTPPEDRAALRTRRKHRPRQCKALVDIINATVERVGSAPGGGDPDARLRRMAEQMDQSGDAMSRLRLTVPELAELAAEYRSMASGIAAAAREVVSAGAEEWNVARNVAADEALERAVQAEAPLVERINAFCQAEP